MIPVLAVQRRTEQSFVWVVHNAPGGGLTTELRPVELGALQEQSYPITGGLKAGERIVVSGVQKLRPGARVTQMPPPGARGAPHGSAG